MIYKRTGSIFAFANEPSAYLINSYGNADLNVMIMKARVDEANIAPVKKGQGSRIFINAFKGTEFKGMVDKVGLKRIVDRDGTGYYEVEILVDRPADTLLRSGLQANADVEVETLYDVLRVPTQAVVDRRVDELPKELAESTVIDKTKAFARVIYTIEDGKAKAVPVSSGSSDLTHTVLLAGGTENVDVITGPFKVLQELRDGRKVIDEVEAKKIKDAKDSKEPKATTKKDGSAESVDSAKESAG